jgi:hypothetical protein
MTRVVFGSHRGRRLLSDGQRDCKHTPVLALLACEVEGCGACGEGDGRRENTSLPKKRQ